MASPDDDLLRRLDYEIRHPQEHSHDALSLRLLREARDRIAQMAQAEEHKCLLSSVGGANGSVGRLFSDAPSVLLARKWLARQRVPDGREPMLDEGDCRMCGRPAGEGHEETDPCGIISGLLERAEQAEAQLREARARIARLAQENDRLSNDIDAFNRTEHDQTGAAMVWHDLYQETCKRAEQAEAQLREAEARVQVWVTDEGESRRADVDTVSVREAERAVEQVNAVWNAERQMLQAALAVAEARVQAVEAAVRTDRSKPSPL